jgi:hypothetical protein
MQFDADATSRTFRQDQQTATNTNHTELLLVFSLPRPQCWTTRFETDWHLAAQVLLATLHPEATR